MPVLKSSIKQMKQNIKRRARNYPVRSELKTLIKKELKLIKDGNLDEAAKFLQKVYSIIDTACKKKLIHANNASRKKSRMAKALNEAQEKAGHKIESGATKEEKKDEKNEK